MYSVDGTLPARVVCPNCHHPMQTRQLEAYAGLRSIDIDVCTDCSLFWFDQYESTSLVPKAVLSLFQSIGQAAAGARTPLAANFRCPRCESALAPTHDLQRTTHFTYWRCANGHGRLITFTQFLREKNFIRPPSPEELIKLKASVRQIACSQCGAPIDLSTDAACPHCGAAIALIDSEGVAKALQALSVATPATTAVDSDKLRAALRDAQVDAIFDHERMREREGGRDLVAIGATAIATLLTALIFRV
jgi:Zn-finger nucleic acid-binding protein